MMEPQKGGWALFPERSVEPGKHQVVGDSGRVWERNCPFCVFETQVERVPGTGKLTKV